LYIHNKLNTQLNPTSSTSTLIVELQMRADSPATKIKRTYAPERSGFQRDCLRKLLSEMDFFELYDNGGLLAPGLCFWRCR